MPGASEITACRVRRLKRTSCHPNHDEAVTPEPTAVVLGASRSQKTVYAPEPLTTDQETQTTQLGVPASLIGRDRGISIIQLESGADFHTHRGTTTRDDQIGVPWGTRVTTYPGVPLILLRLFTDHLVCNLIRTTRILYLKEAQHIFSKPNLAPGRRGIEAGTGSNELKLALARGVQALGDVTPYEVCAVRGNWPALPRNKSTWHSMSRSDTTISEMASTSTTQTPHFSMSPILGTTAVKPMPHCLAGDSLDLSYRLPIR